MTMGRCRQTLHFIFAVSLLWNAVFSGAVFADDEPAPANVVISEVQTASEASASEEFVELYNPGDAEVDLVGWKVEYKSASGASWSTKATLTGMIPGRGLYVLSTAGYIDGANEVLASGLAAGGGHVRLSDVSGQAADLVGWGKAIAAESNAPAIAHEAGKSIQRCFEADELIDSNNNLADFAVYAEVTPGEGIACPLPGETPPPDGVSCDGLIISEILPNPTGSDDGKEFIELYNPTTDFIPLDGCGLQTSSSSQIYWFTTGIELAPNTYRAFYEDVTNLTLLNSSGGTVYLLSASETELSQASYSAGLVDDQAWALFGSSDWQPTYKLTPGLANSLLSVKPCPAGQTRNKETGRCHKPTVGSDLKPCSSTQRRNPATNRCRSILAATASLQPCAADQVRNPLTNRCRKVGSASSSLKPCAADQTRNPLTNRCRKIGSTGSELKLCAPNQARNPATNRCRLKVNAANQLKPCQPGQERNPDTNRCRLAISGSANPANPLGTPAAVPTSPVSTGLVATTTALALAYGAYEFRHDIRNRLHLIKQHLGNRHHSGP